jgi:exosortase A
MDDVSPATAEKQSVQVNLATGVRAKAWKKTAILLGLCSAVWVGVYWSTIGSIVSIWNRSETFAHGFLIVPISLYLVWQKRRELRALIPQADYRGVVALGVLGAGWLLARSVDVLVLQQFCLVGMVPALVWAILGWDVIRTVAFPLGFLLLGVPIGEGLVPPMMKFTARFAATAVKLTGIPVYWEGLFITLPNGNWSIVEACSGVRYLIASVTLGFLYAYLSYRSFWRRALFVALSFIVPVIANGVRAYLIIMIGYLSDMRLAAGVDHLIYGWVFFGFVMLLLFWFGSFWREKGDELVEEQEQRVITKDQTAMRGGHLIAIGISALVMIVIWPAWSTYADSQAGAVGRVELSLPVEMGSWRLTNEPVTSWRPRYLGMDGELELTYGNGRAQVTLYIPYYRVQSQDKELVNTQNVLIPQKHPVWNEITNRIRTETLGARVLQVREALLQSNAQNLLIWHWYWIGGRHTTNSYFAKLLEAYERLFGGSSEAAGIIVYAEYEIRPQEAEDVLRSFLVDVMPFVEQELASAARCGDFGRAGS